LLLKKFFSRRIFRQPNCENGCITLIIELLTLSEEICGKSIFGVLEDIIPIPLKNVIKNRRLFYE